MEGNLKEWKWIEWVGENEEENYWKISEKLNITNIRHLYPILCFLLLSKIKIETRNPL